MIKKYKDLILNHKSNKFNQKNNFKITESKKNLKEILAIIFVMFIAILFSLNSPLNIFKRGVSETDSSVFRLLGILISKGYTPYLDFFDHKGPFIYLINCLGFIVNKNFGIWIIEIIFLCLSFIFIYKTARLKTNMLGSILSLFLVIGNLFTYFEGGNLVEEYALPFILLSLYIFVDYLINNNVTKLKIILCGISFAFVCLLRANMISCWIVFCLAIFIKMFLNKDYKNLINYVVYFLIGCFVVFVPIFIWLITKGAFFDFINDYVIFNIKYSSSAIVDKWNSLFSFSNNIIIIIAISTNIYAILKEKDKTVYISNLCFILLTLITIALPGRMYNHYAIILIPTLVIPFSYFINIILTCTNTNISTLIIIYIFSNLVFPMWISFVQQIGVDFNNSFIETENDSDVILKIREIVDNKTTINDKISVYGNWDYIYLVTNRMPASKYSYQFPIGNIDHKIFEEYFKELQQNKPKIIVIQELDPIVNDFVNNENYEKIWNNNQVYVYELK